MKMKQIKKADKTIEMLLNSKSVQKLNEKMQLTIKGGDGNLGDPGGHGWVGDEDGTGI